MTVGVSEVHWAGVGDVRFVTVRLYAVTCYRGSGVDRNTYPDVSAFTVLVSSILLAVYAGSVALNRPAPRERTRVYCWG